jgi:signal transduction histidine kinase
MPLRQFIEEHRETIVEHWVDFARTMIPRASTMTETELRDHAEDLLTAVVSDMVVPENPAQQSEKSQGTRHGSAIAPVGRKHASQRLHTGFNLDQLVSEFRALRASVLRLWQEAEGNAENEVTRFNEAIDEGLAESASKYTEMMARTREQFLAVLGHDLRSPLAAILMGATALTQSKNMNDRDARIATRIRSSAARMTRMVGDLLDLTRTRLGSSIPVSPRPMDLVQVCDQVVAEFNAIHAGAGVTFTGSGDLTGEWDSDRLTQLVSNLVGNAVQYGSAEEEVTVEAEGREQAVVLRVHNGGPPIAAPAMKQIFEPMVREIAKVNDGNAGGLGLGLYIARAVVLAHGGAIDAASAEGAGTTFTVELPRKPAPPAG